MNLKRIFSHSIFPSLYRFLLLPSYFAVNISEHLSHYIIYMLIIISFSLISLIMYQNRVITSNMKKSIFYLYCIFKQ